MWKFGVPAVKNMEKAREDRIRNDLEGAEKAKTDAEAEKAQYLAQIAGAKDEAGRLIEEARQAAESVRADLIARAEQEANDIRARAAGRHRQPDATRRWRNCGPTSRRCRSTSRVASSSATSTATPTASSSTASSTRSSGSN